jgi:hypothetical protein
MPEFITFEFLFAVAGFVATIEGLRRHHNARIEKIKTDGHENWFKTNTDLQIYKLHVAETYASKDSVGKQFESVAASVKDVGERMDRGLSGMSERLDRVIENGHMKPVSRRSA